MKLVMPQMDVKLPEWKETEKARLLLEIKSRMQQINEESGKLPAATWEACNDCRNSDLENFSCYDLNTLSRQLREVMARLQQVNAGLARVRKPTRTKMDQILDVMEEFF